MPTPITRHVRSLTTSTSAEPFQPFWNDFTRLVRSEWRRQQVGSLPPAILGYPGYRSWHDAWDELQNDCYLQAVLQPARDLLAALEGEPPGTSLDALVRLEIRHHLQERRDQNDPIGASVYRRVCSVLRRMVDTGPLVAAPLRNGRHFRRDTVLAFPGLPDAVLVPAVELGALMPTLPGWAGLRILLASTRRATALPARLAAFVLALGRGRCQRFRLLDLVELLQQAARETARELMRSRAGTPVAARAGQELPGTLSRPEDAVDGYFLAGDFEELCRRVCRRIEASSRGDARRNRLRVFEACLPALRQGEWPSVRDVVERLAQDGAPVARGSVGDHLRFVKAFWEEEKER
jgi:hypothetical protein